LNKSFKKTSNKLTNGVLLNYPHVRNCVIELNTVKPFFNTTPVKRPVFPWITYLTHMVLKQINVFRILML